MDDSKTASQFVKIEEIRGVVHFVLNLPQREKAVFISDSTQKNEELAGIYNSHGPLARVSSVFGHFCRPSLSVSMRRTILCTKII
jgi:hypothetical protein